ncbi:MAG TPA: amidase family protein, partial [Xanthobacteraceae bacterium]
MDEAMTPAEINTYDATTAQRMITDGRFTASDYLRACLKRIDERESDIGAWAYIARENALRQVANLQSDGERSSLRGIPVAIKDIIATY